MVQQAEISPVGAGTVAIAQTSHVVETDGSVYDLYSFTATAAQGYRFSRYEITFVHTYNNRPGETSVDTYRFNPLNNIGEQTQTPDFGGNYHNIEVTRVVAYFTQDTKTYDGVLRNDDGVILRNASGVVLIGAEYRP